MKPRPVPVWPRFMTMLLVSLPFMWPLASALHGIHLTVTS